MSELLDDDQSVKGIVIAQEDDLKLRRALSVTNNIEFMTYEVRFTLNRHWLKFKKRDWTNVVCFWSNVTSTEPRVPAQNLLTAITLSQ